VHYVGERSSFSRRAKWAFESELLAQDAGNLVAFWFQEINYWKGTLDKRSEQHITFIKGIWIVKETK